MKKQNEKKRRNDRTRRLLYIPIVLSLIASVLFAVKDHEKAQAAQNTQNAGLEARNIMREYFTASTHRRAKIDEITRCTGEYEARHESKVDFDVYLEEKPAETNPETVQETEPQTEAQAVQQAEPRYAVGHEELTEEMQSYLYSRLAANGAADFLPWAVLQIYQESNFKADDITSHSDGTNDCGLLQYKDIYWASHCAKAGQTVGDIMDWRKQIDVYAVRVGQYLAAGKSVEWTISAHYTGGYGYSDEYVQQVFSNLEKLRRTK